jgi:hypothetical protein
MKAWTIRLQLIEYEMNPFGSDAQASEQFSDTTGTIIQTTQTFFGLESVARSGLGHVYNALTDFEHRYHRGAGTGTVQAKYLEAQPDASDEP